MMQNSSQSRLDKLMFYSPTKTPKNYTQINKNIQNDQKNKNPPLKKDILQNKFSSSKPNKQINENIQSFQRKQSYKCFNRNNNQNDNLTNPIRYINKHMLVLSAVQQNNNVDDFLPITVLNKNLSDNHDKTPEGVNNNVNKEKRFPSFLSSKSQRKKIKKCIQIIKDQIKDQLTDRSATNELRKKYGHIKSHSTFQQKNLTSIPILQNSNSKQNFHPSPTLQFKRPKLKSIFFTNNSSLRQSIIQNVNTQSIDKKKEILMFDQIKERLRRNNQEKAHTDQIHLKAEMQRLLTNQHSIIKLHQVIVDQSIHPINSFMQVKQSLVGCDLFSDQDIQSFLKAHDKKNNESLSNSIKNNLQKHQQNYISNCDPNKTSLGDLIQQSFCSSEQKQPRLSVQYHQAELCLQNQKKRSRWILQQTDTIKQSLKELSEYNTQKTIQDNVFLSNKHIKASFLRQNVKSIQYFQGILEEDTHCQTMPDDQIVDHINISQFQLKYQSEQSIFFNLKIHFIRQQGTFITYQARDKSTGLLCCIQKYQKSDLRSLDIQYQQKFIQKLRIQMSIINHPNIEKIYGIFQDSDHLYVITQFCEKKIINYDSSSWNTYQMQDYILKTQIITQIIDSVQQLHLNQLLHKNIRPTNMNMVFDSCKITGFNQCQFIKTQNHSQYDQQYICPELRLDNSQTAVDIWSLGIFIQQLLLNTKSVRYSQNINSMYLNQNQKCIQPYIQQIIKMALKRNPRERPSIFTLKNKWRKISLNFNKQYTSRCEKPMQKYHKQLQLLF